MCFRNLKSGVLTKQAIVVFVGAALKFRGSYVFPIFYTVVVPSFELQGFKFQPYLDTNRILNGKTGAGRVIKYPPSSFKTGIKQIQFVIYTNQLAVNVVCLLKFRMLSTSL